MIFHLTSEKLWKRGLNDGEYRPESLAKDGFIHFSALGQILNVANSFYKSVDDSVLLAVENKNLSELKWEGEDGLEFPHLYRPLCSSDVEKVIPLSRNNLGDYVSNPLLEEAAGAVRIETPRLILREFQITDYEAVHFYGSDPEITKFMPWGPNSVTDTRAFLTRKFKEQSEMPRLKCDLAITCKTTGELFGACGVMTQNEQAQTAFLGYVMKKSAHGKGYATEFARAVIEYAFKHMNLYRIEATCDAENKASFNVMKKIGMQQEALLRGNLVYKNRRRDTIVCSILKNEL